MEPDSLLPNSQVHATCRYILPTRSSTYPHFRKPEFPSYYNPPSTPVSPKLSLSVTIPDQNAVYTSPFPIHATRPALLNFVTCI